MAGAASGFMTLFVLAIALYLMMVMMKGKGLAGLQNLLKGQPVQAQTQTCPTGQTGTPPNCVQAPAKCPAGETGTPPNCKKAETPKSGGGGGNGKKNGNGGNGNGNGGNGNGNGGDGGGDDDDEDGDNGNGGNGKKSGGGKKTPKSPYDKSRCACPSKPTCEHLCNSPAFYDACCPDVGAKRSTVVYNAHMMAYVANSY